MKRTLWALALVVAIAGVSGCESAGSPVLEPAASKTTTADESPNPGGAAAGHSHGPVTAGRPGHLVVNLSADANQQIARLRAQMAAFHNFEKALAAGWDVPAPGPGVCISDPVRGGMGFHYTRSDKDLIGDGKVNLFEPEFLVYSPKKNGGVRFSALDYFVPFDTWTEDAPPSLLGVPFVSEEAMGAYVLHIWLFWHNPAGIFENFNPDVPLC